MHICQTRWYARGWASMRPSNFEQVEQLSKETPFPLIIPLAGLCRCCGYREQRNDKYIKVITWYFLLGTLLFNRKVQRRVHSLQLHCGKVRKTSVIMMRAPSAQCACSVRCAPFRTQANAAPLQLAIGGLWLFLVRSLLCQKKSKAKAGKRRSYVSLVLNTTPCYNICSLCP